MANEAVAKPSRYSEKYWKQEITLATDLRKKFCDHAKESIKVYNSTHDLKEIQRKLNIWWYCVNTLLPDYYSSTPKVQVGLKKRAGSSIYQIASTVWERATQYQMDEGFDFDGVGLNAALQVLLTGQATLWARYEAEIETQAKEIGLIQTPDGKLVTADGTPYEGDTSAAQGNPDGSYSVTQEVEAKASEEAVLETVNYDDFLTSDGRNDSEISWKARRAFLSQDEATEIFGADTADDLSYDSFPEAIKSNKAREHDAYDGKAELWEIWCEESGKVYWLQNRGEKSIIEEGDPPLKFEDFYPCVTIAASTDPESIVPTSDYVHCRDQILEVERLTTRIHAVTQAVRTNSAYDATLGSTIEGLLDGDLKMIPVTSWPAYKNRGGLASSIEAFNIDPYLKALEVLSGKREEAKQQLFETLKVSDLLRGASDPTKTATANRLESSWSSLGLIVRQNQFAKFISGGISKLGTIIAQHFDPAWILEAGDAKGLIEPLCNGDQQAMMGMEQQVIEILRNDTDRCYRIEISSDSMVALDQNQERQEGQEMMGAAGQFFQQMEGIIEKYPPLTIFSMQLFQNVIRRYRGGKELEPIFLQAMQQVGQIVEQQQSQPPPPDPSAQAAQAQIQIAQMEAQTMQAKTQLDMQVEQVKAQMDMQQAQFDQQVKLKELDLQAQQIQIDLMKVQLEQQKVANDAALTNKQIETDATKSAIQMQMDKEVADLNGFIAQQKLEIDALATKMHAWEKINEERRLAAVELGSKTTPLPQPAPQINFPPMTFHVGTGKQKITSSKDPITGQMTHVKENLPD